MKQNKYLYFWIIQGRKDGRFRDVEKIQSAPGARKQAQERLKALLTGNYDYDRFKLLDARRREKNPDYQEKTS